MASIPRYLTGPLTVALEVGVVAAVMASAIAWRIADRPDTPALWTILPWQLAVWAPWTGYFYAIKWLSGRLEPLHLTSPAVVGAHGLAALLVAASHLVWFWQVSNFLSPLRGLPETRFGVYAFFFVFWFLIDLLLYVAVLVAPDRWMRRHAPEPEPGVRPEAPPAPRACRDTLAVRKGRARHVVRTDDIFWIEAQGYYAALHTASGC